MHSLLRQCAVEALKDDSLLVLVERVVCHYPSKVVCHCFSIVVCHYYPSTLWRSFVRLCGRQDCQVASLGLLASRDEHVELERRVDPLVLI